MAQRWPKRRGRAAAAATSRIVVEVRTTTCARAGCKPVTVAGPQVWHVPIVLVPAAPGGRPARAAVCDVAAPANAFTHTIAGARPAVAAPGERAPLGAAAAAAPRAAVADASTDGDATAGGATATAADTAEADAHAAKRVVRGAAHAAVRGLAHAASLQRPAESAVFSVEGMTCGACVDGIERTIGGRAGTVSLRPKRRVFPSLLSRSLSFFFVLYFLSRSRPRSLSPPCAAPLLQALPRGSCVGRCPT